MEFNTNTPYPTYFEDGRCLFNVWAPKAGDVNLVITDTGLELPMTRRERGYWTLTTDKAPVGTRYKYKLNNKGLFPDPASLSQPEGVHEASQTIRLSTFKWSDRHWKNIPLEEMIQYELHTGTFTREGSFDGVRSRLHYLKELGINAIELLPVAQFSGHRNWGYDGVYPFAVHNSYGGAHALMRLVDECHRAGIAVILDVVYNHFGPEGNYVDHFGYYFSDKYGTPWGHPINFDGAYSDEVRQFVIQNALMWLRDFHIDGLRLDAVHAIYDFGATHIMQALHEAVQQLSAETGRPYHLIAETNQNDVRYISPPSKGGYGLSGQWNDDFHHVLHHLITGEKSGYYGDYVDSHHLLKVMKEAYVYSGQYSAFRKKSYGNSALNNPASQFVVFTQNHDQVGNRRQGERLITLGGFEAAKLAAGVLFVSPFVPMLFMGEEYGERAPFYYFVSHLDAHLNKMVREGREREFSAFYNGEEPVKDPADPETFDASKLSWAIEQSEEKKAMLNFYKTLIRLRKENPVLKTADKENLDIIGNNEVYILKRWQGDNQILAVMNFMNENRQVVLPPVKGHLQKVVDSADKQWLGAGSPAVMMVQEGSRVEVSGRSVVIYARK